MAYDEKLAERMRKILKKNRGVSEKKRFCGIIRDDRVVRIGKDRNNEALAKPHARPMNFTGKPMAGFIFVSPAGTRTEKALENWIRMGLEFVSKS